MSTSNTKHASGSSLRRTRSAGDEPTASTSQVGPLAEISRRNEESDTSGSTMITIPKIASRGPRSAGPAFTTFMQESIPERSETESISITTPLPRSPPPAVLHTPHSAAPILPSNNTQERPRPYPANYSTITRILLFFGHGRDASKVRRALVSLIWNLSWGFAQMVVIIAVLASSASKPSPTVPGANEWVACDRPLGLWACLWLARVIVACVLAYWGWTRDKVTQSNRTDAESGQNVSSASSPSSPTHPRPHSRRPLPSSRREIPNSSRSPTTETTPALPHTNMFRRLSLFASLFSLTWFLTAHILVYTSLKTCRFSSPHVWWLVFGILCITYLMVLEVILLGLIVFVFAPVVFLIWNIFLLCIGRHPLQNPHMIKPEIGKIPKSLVDQIPLVMYIPPPPDAPQTDEVQIPETAYSYPPKPPQKDIPKRRFRFIKKFAKRTSKQDPSDASSGKNGGDNEKSTEPGSWEDNWDTEGYPHVVLSDNRAACAICLLDFEEPKRLHGAPETQAKAIDGSAEGSKGEITAQTVEVITEQERENDPLRLADAGEAAQPLRLLSCGHVFHKTCLDPWLTDVSGRCPVCQRPVEIPETQKKKKRRT